MDKETSEKKKSGKKERRLNYAECIEQARGRIGNYCKACVECNGRACRNQMPGPGAKGIGDTAMRNYDKWKEIRVQMDTIVENAPVDTSLKLFGKEFKYPFFAGPVGAVNLHYGDCLNDISYNDILVSSCAECGIAAFTGDGTDSNVMVAATKAIAKEQGLGIPTVKPWNLEIIKEKIFFVLVVNSPVVASFKNISMDAKINDGKLDMILLKQCNIPELMKIVADTVAGKTSFDNKNIIYKQASYFKFSCPDRVESDLDGELGPVLPLEIHTVSNKLKMFVL